MFELLIIFSTGALGVIALIAILNTLTFPRLNPPLSHWVAEGDNQSLYGVRAISILIPARNEAPVIGDTVRALLAQPEATEIILLDDGSTDSTAAIALQAAQGDPRLRVLRGQPLPPDWLGKNWACHQLAHAASYPLLLFTDADVIWHPASLGALLTAFDSLNADLLTVWPTQITQTWGERLVVPLMALAIMGYLPALAVHHLPFSAFAAAMGQCLLFRRDAYEKIGGHAAVRGNIVEDVAFAKKIKRTGLRLRMADGNGLSACRMYRSWAEVRNGFAKNILAGHGSLSALLVSTIFHWVIFILPLALFIWNLAGGVWDFGALALFGLGLLIRALTAATTRQRVGDALFMPLSVGLMTIIAAQALRWRFSGGPQWKGRIAKREA